MRILTTVLMTVVSISGKAQSEDDIVRFSQLGISGSARYMGMGGAMGALGADFSVVTINPAGLGRYSANSFTLTPSLDMTNSTGLFQGSEAQKKDVMLRFPDISLVRNFPTSSENWNSIQVGIGHTRLVNFNNEMVYEGEIASSMLHDFSEQAYGMEPEEVFSNLPFTSFLGYYTYAINDAPFYDENGNVFYIPEIPYDSLVRHERTISRSGRQNEYNFTVSGNYKNKLYIGASVAMQRIKFNEVWQHNEILLDTTNLFIRSFDYTYDLEIRGRGYNLKVGIIYLPDDWLRLGLAIHSPTRFLMEDRWTSDMVTEFFDVSIPVDDEFKPTGSFSYIMRTPFRATASGAMVINKRGIISVDVDYVDYTTGIFKPIKNDNFTDYTATNLNVRDRLKAAFNLRSGIDIRIAGGFSWRFGMGFYGNAFREELINTKPNRRFFSTGFGLRYKEFFFDMAYMQQQWNEDYFAYFTNEFPVSAVFRNRQSTINMTFGFRF